MCGCNGGGKHGSGSEESQWQLACPPLRLVRVPSADGAGVGSPAPRQKQRRPQVPEELTVNKILWVADDSKVTKSRPACGHLHAWVQSQVASKPDVNGMALPAISRTNMAWLEHRFCQCCCNGYSQSCKSSPKDTGRQRVCSAAVAMIAGVEPLELICRLPMLAVVLSACACSSWQQHVIAPYVCGTPSPGRCSCCCKATVTQCMSCQGTLLTLVLSCLLAMMAESYSGTLQPELRSRGGLFSA